MIDLDARDDEIATLAARSGRWGDRRSGHPLRAAAGNHLVFVLVLLAIAGGCDDAGGTQLPVDAADDAGGAQLPVDAADAGGGQLPVDAAGDTGGQIPVDAADGGQLPDDAGDGQILMGRHSFVVTSAIAARSDASSLGGPSSHTFTLVLDGDSRIAIAGTSLGAKSFPFEAGAAGTYRVRNLAILTSGGCGTTVTYDELTFAIDASGRLSGTGRGNVFWLITDLGQRFDADMSLTGVPDFQRPSLALSISGALDDPFASRWLSASEPLPPGQAPALVDGNEQRLPFQPSASAGGFALSFVLSPPKLLRYGESYRVALDGVADFAGNAVAASAANELRFTTRMAPPLVEEDGFESATGEALGGASVLSGAGAPVISGARSLYIPPARGSGSTSTQLSLRLPRAPGDTVLRFAFRRVTDRLSGSGNHTTTLFQVAGQGGEIASLVERAAEPTEEITIPGATAPVRIGPIMTAEIALPPDATGEVVVARIATETPRAELCAGFPARPIAGVIIDDLRAE